MSEPVRQIGDVTVGELMSKSPRTVRPETSIEELTELLTVFDYNGFPVVSEAGVLEGLVTRIDLFKLYLAPYRGAPEPAGATVAAIMTRGVISVGPNEPARKAIALMVDHRIQTIPVVSETPAGATVVGVVTRRDLAGALKP